MFRIVSVTPSLEEAIQNDLAMSIQGNVQSRLDVRRWIGEYFDGLEGLAASTFDILQQLVKVAFKAGGSNPMLSSMCISLSLAVFHYALLHRVGFYNMKVLQISVQELRHSQPKDFKVIDHFALAHFLQKVVFLEESDRFFLAVRNTITVEFVCRVFDRRFAHKVFDVIPVQGTVKSLCLLQLQFDVAHKVFIEIMEIKC